MKVLQTIPEFGIKSGGTTTCTYDLVSALNSMDYFTELLTLNISDPLDRLVGVGEHWITALPVDSKTPFGYSKNLLHFLQKSNYQLYHTNGLWMYCNHITCKVAREKNKPYIITPHGMLYPQALKHSYWKKYFFLKLYFKKDIMDATCLHVTCKQELEYVRSFGYKGPIALIPNALNLSNTNNAVPFLSNSVVRFGFLGRLHPRKKVENILYGAARLKDRGDDFKILIMGKGDEEYESFLKSEVKRLGLRNVEFCGFVDGLKKYEYLSSLSILIVPSDFENFGMIVAESLSVGTPVMANVGTPWELLNIQHCGWWLNCSPDNIALIMNKVLDMPVDLLKEMGGNGMRLIENNFSVMKVAREMALLYDWILNKGAKPHFVYYD